MNLQEAQGLVLDFQEVSSLASLRTLGLKLEFRRLREILWVAQGLRLDSTKTLKESKFDYGKIPENPTPSGGSPENDHG